MDIIHDYDQVVASTIKITRKKVDSWLVDSMEAEEVLPGQSWLILIKYYTLLGCHHLQGWVSPSASGSRVSSLPSLTHLILLFPYHPSSPSRPPIDWPKTLRSILTAYAHYTTIILISSPCWHFDWTWAVPSRGFISCSSIPVRVSISTTSIPDSISTYYTRPSTRILTDLTWDFRQLDPYHHHQFT